MSDYVDLVCIRALSGDIRRLLYYELLRCSGIHLEESGLMTELYGAHPDNYCSSLIKQTTSRDLCHALSHSIIFSSLCSFSLPLSLLFFGICLLSLSALFPLHLLHSSPSILFNCHLPLAISVIQIPLNSQCHRQRVGEIKSNRGDDERRNDP